MRNIGRVRAGRDLAKKLVAETERRPGDRYFFQAATASALGAGNCGEYANIGRIVHSAKVLPRETSVVVGHKTVDHAWTESRPAGDAAREHTIVIDGWAEGPPVFAPDGAFTASAQDIFTLGRLPRETLGARAPRLLDDLEQRIRTHFGDEGLQALVPATPSKLPTTGIFSPTPVVAAAFSDRVKPRLATGGLSAEIVAAGAARSLGQPIHALRADVPAILEIAQQVLP
jgi:hypothetical protein